MAWISVSKYCKLKGIKSPQIVYNKIAMNKLKKEVDWREVEIKVKRKEMFYDKC